ncbi:oligosaccharide flippase family protein [Anabaena sp. UHCC 0187]|uniref:oligosaccharide flippase family protein n=1 Tax=Anabaena sp. UHCC 0187 TaxID=2590018 RepID=UPI001445D1BC|nr:oligosaccharide flippase family protein [Anabaena sp. UHCC 0187]
MKNSLLKNGFYNTVGGVVRIGLAVLTIPILIRMLGIEEYGLWTLASAVVQVVNLAEAGLSVATTVFVSQDIVKEDADDLSNSLSETLTVTFGGMLIFATLAAIALLFGAEAIVSLFPKLGQVQQVTIQHTLQIGGLVVWARLLQRVLIGVEQAYQRYDLISLFSTIESLLLSFGMLIVTWLGGRTIALMQWQALAAIAILLSHVWVLRNLTHNVKLHVNWNQKRGLAIARYSLMSWLTLLGGIIFARGDRLIVGSLLDTQTLGVYAVMTDITTQINSLSALPVQPLLPSVSNLAANLDTHEAKLQKQVKQALQINSFIALVIGAGLFTLADDVLHLFIPGIFSKENIAAFYILVMIYSLYSINAVGYYLLLALNAADKCMLIQLISGISSLLLIAIGANQFGLVGASLGNSGYLIIWLLTFFGMRQLFIPLKRWLIWLRYPLLWFFVVIMINFFLPSQLEVKIFTFFLETVLLTVWFIYEQNINVSSAIRRLFIKFVRS